MKLVRFDEEALDELFEDAAWYNSQQPGLARRFLDEIDGAECGINNNISKYLISHQPQSSKRGVAGRLDTVQEVQSIPQFQLTLH